MFKKILIGISAFIALILVAAIVLPIIYKDKIKSLAVEEINKSLKATVSLGDVSLSLFRNFPNFSFSMEDFTIINHAPFEGDTLAHMGDFRFEIDLMSVLSGADLNIKSIAIADANFNLKMLADESVNWDITIADTTLEEEVDTTASAFAFAIQKYSLKNVNLTYDDAFYKQKAVITGMDHVGTGDFTLDDFVLKTMTDIASLDYSYEGVKYISKAKGKFDVPIAINMPAFSFTFTENDLFLNELNLKFAGVVAMPSDDISMDLVFNTPQSDFRALLSVVPGIFNEYFEDIKTSGKFIFDGKMKGVYNDTSMPAFDFKLLVDNGYFQYPDLPAAVKNIVMDLHITNPNGDLDATVVDLKNFSLDLGGNPFSMRLLTSHPMSDPRIDASLKANINLAEVKNWYPVEEVKALEGRIAADLTAKGNMSAIDQKRFSDFVLDGQMTLTDFHTQYEGIEQGVDIKKASMRFSPQFVSLDEFSVQMGSSDFQANGRIDNLVQYYFDADVLRGTFNTASNLLNLNELMGEDDAVTPEEPATDSTSLEVFEIPANIDFALNANYKKLIYDNMDITNMVGALVLRDQAVGFKEVSMNLLGGTIQMGGEYNSQNIKMPSIDFKLALQEFGMQEMFKTFVTMQKVAPIAQYTSGNFSTGFDLEGILLQDMTPDLNTLSGGGLLKIPNATISGYKPLEKLAEVVKMDNLRKMMISDIQLSFEFEKGRLYVQPFDINYQDIKLTIFGSNGFDQTLDYTINMAVPRAKLGAANTFMQGISKQAAGKGIDLNLSPVINIKVRMTGTNTDPKITADLGDMAGDAAANLKQQALDELERRKKELEDKAKAEAERLKQDLASKKDEAEKKAREELAKKRQQAKAEADKILADAKVQSDRLRTEGKRAGDLIRNEGDDAAKKLIAEAGSNPVKKIAAEKASEQLKKQAETRAQQTEREANTRADQLMAEAQKRANQLLNP